MKKIIKFLVIILTIFLNIFCNIAFADNIKNNVKIKLTFDNKEVIVIMYNNSASKQIINILPSTFEFRDFAGKEKVTDFSKPLKLENAPRGMVAKTGEMFIYAPWGNMGIFYKDGESEFDKNLIPLGKVESGLDFLSSQKDNFEAKIENIK